MGSKLNYVLGAVTIGLIVGGTIYAIKKSKEAEAQEEQAISLSEAREMVEKRRKEQKEVEELAEEIYFESEIEEVEEQPERKIHIVKASEYDEHEETYEEEDEDEDGIDENIEGPYIPTVEPLNDFMYYEEGIDPKEDKTLRFDKNSVEAKHQFIRMELADFQPNDDAYRIMLQLFEIPFIPNNDGDEILRTQVIDYKVQFFGFGSKWAREVSFADIMFHYARAAEFNVGESVDYWINYFLQFNDFQWDSTSQEFDTLIMRLNSHSYFNEERQTFGLFGLTRQSMDQAIRIANMNIDRSVTYEIEFQEFLKSCV